MVYLKNNQSLFPPSLFHTQKNRREIPKTGVSFLLITAEPDAAYFLSAEASSREASFMRLGDR